LAGGVIAAFAFRYLIVPLMTSKDLKNVCRCDQAGENE